MAVKARHRIGDRFIFIVDAAPTHTAPDGSIAMQTGSGDTLYTRKAGAWVAVTGGGGGGSVTPASVDFDRPTSPSAENDEFESTTLDAKWSQTLTGSPTVDIDTTWKSALCARFTTSGQAVALRQAFVPGAGVACSLTARFIGFFQTQFGGVTLKLMDTAESNMAYLTFGFVSAEQRVRVHKKVSGVDTFDIVSRVIAEVDEIWLHLQRDTSDVWSFWYSYNGRSWRRLTTFTQALTVQKIFVETASSSQTVAVRSGVDFVRRDWLTL